MLAYTPPLQVLHTSVSRNFWKGGDFMEREQDPANQAAIQDAIRRMNWEGCPWEEDPKPFYPAIKPEQEVVLDARQDPTHPLRKGNQ